MGKRIVILGGAESGTGAAMLAAKEGMDVFVSDYGTLKEKYKTTLTQAGIPFEEGKHTMERILNADEIIKSPGIADDTPIMQKVYAKDIPVLSEIEFAGRYTRAKKICITGSNGKTTTTLLTWHILKNAGLNAGLAGNIGESFAMQVMKHDFDWYVLEVSSFQLDNMYSFKADIAVITNITEDHLDRYDYNFQKYINSKFRILQNQEAEDAFIYCLDDEVTRSEVQKRKIAARVYPFSTFQRLEQGAYTYTNRLFINTNKETFDMTLEELALQGRHNIYNSMAASIAGRLIEIRKESIRQSLSDFQNIEHRLEHIARVDGVDFVNDSKATNVNSTWFALETIDRPIIWIAGGIDKGNDYSKLNDLVKSKVKALICLGTDNHKLIDAFSGIIETIYEARSAEVAVLQANSIAKPGDTVLLSPACSSFDLFENYEDRGNQFKMAVKSL